MEQPGLDGHRDKNGRARKHGNTLISTLRGTYGRISRPTVPQMLSSATCSTGWTSCR
jgi:hypothetical protein